MTTPLHIVCPHCHTVNRVAVERLAHGPNCGKCHQPLFDAHPVALDATTLPRHLANSSLPLLVDFWAPWCAPCRTMAPQFTEAARLLEPELRLAKVNTEAEQQLGAQFAIRSIPTLALFVDGREVARQAGAMAAQDIVRWVRRHLPG
jgi:thioredoxin 2